MTRNDKPKPLVLTVLDGWGIGPNYSGNAIYNANIPNYKRLLASYPNGHLLASGEAVGLPKGEQGNSEVGHLNLGAGTIVYQDLPRINISIASGDFLHNDVLLKAVEYATSHHSKIHIMGLVGPSSVHSSINHLYAILWLLKEKNFGGFFIHAFTDGRDSSPNYGQTIILELEKHLLDLGMGRIATVSGRYYAMDRDNRWERTKLCYDALVAGLGLTAASGHDAITQAYNRNETDEFIKPTVIIKDNKPVCTIDDNDVIISFNFRTDRMRQLIEAFSLPDFENFVPVKYEFDIHKDSFLLLKKSEDAFSAKTFARGKIARNLFISTMTQYEKKLPVQVIFPPIKVNLPLSGVFSGLNLRQLHISETEKYPHVTYFFNGGREMPFNFEDVVEIPSPMVATYDLKPEMSAFEVTEELIKRINNNNYDFIVVNYANPDMVGHTGNLTATIKACEAVDLCLGKLMVALETKNGGLVLVGDHGNAELKTDPETSAIITSHTTNPVPVVLAVPQYRGQPQNLGQGILADVAPTILKIMNLPIPSDMTGRVLI
ncbi:MAG: 2,3-bisphosphoglycerate-independent phosphoglycerate mutase [Patescibacteria group bacterium]|nr:2,3-bisphosphoglycerate-independent phosphoglycerate mutase [Patescibacteria group bacterium]